MKGDKILEKYPNSPRLFNVHEICNNPRFGELNFAEVEDILREMSDSIIELENYDYKFKLKTQRDIQNIDGARKQVIDFLNLINTFDLKQADSNQRRQNFINEVKSRKESFYRDIQVPLIQLQQDAQISKVNLKNLAEKQAEFNSAIHETQNLKTQLQEELNELKKKKEELRSGELALGTTSLSKDFQGQYEYHKKVATFWFKVMIGIYVIFFLVLLLFALFFLIFLKTFDLTDLKHYLQLIFEIIILSTIFYALSFSRKNYNIERNLELRNRSKRTFADTLDRFLSSQTEMDFKKDMLQKAARSMFLLEHTGYLDKDETSINPTHEVISNVIKSQMPPGK